MRFVIVLTVLINVVYVEGACYSGVGKDVCEDLMNVMRKMKCKTDNSGTKRKPAFFATLTSGLSLGTNTVIKFDSVKTNIKNGYDPSTGVFTAPEAGLYEFSVNFVKGNENNWIELNLMKNKDIIARGHGAKDPHTSGSIQAILELQKGDKMFVRNPRSYGKITGGAYCMFSGYLL